MYMIDIDHISVIIGCDLLKKCRPPGADWTCRPTAPTGGGPLAQPCIFYELICCETYLNFH